QRGELPGRVAEVKAVGRQSAHLTAEQYRALCCQLLSERARLLDDAGGVERADATPEEHRHHGGRAQHIDDEARAVARSIGGWDGGELDAHGGGLAGVRR